MKHYSNMLYLRFYMPDYIKTFYLAAILMSLATSIQAQAFEYVPVEYGPKRSVGLSIFGEGLAGIVVKIVQPNQNQWEIIGSFAMAAQILLDSNDDIESVNLYNGVSLLGGYNLMTGSRYKSKKDKVIKNYIGLKTGVVNLSTLDYRAGVHWHREAFRAKDFAYSRGLDLGLMYYTDDDNIIQGDQMVKLYLRLEWNWFR